MLSRMDVQLETEQLSILSLNCQHGRQPGLKAFLDRIRSEKKYDFVLLQEVNRSVAAMIPDDESGRLKIKVIHVDKNNRPYVETKDKSIS